MQPAHTHTGTHMHKRRLGNYYYIRQKTTKLYIHYFILLNTHIHTAYWSTLE